MRRASRAVKMSDVFSKAKRSEVMSRIRGRGNLDTELALIRLFRANQITGWRRNQRVFGKPDFAFMKKQLAVFVDGCFWHSCPSHSNAPVNNQEFWLRKLTANRKRDLLVNRTLRSRGWTVIRIWEHELSRKNESRLIRRLLRALQSELTANNTRPRVENISAVRRKT
jgi:DNA mismatch endonuclease (patch repair protein)